MKLKKFPPTLSSCKQRSCSQHRRGSPPSWAWCCWCWWWAWCSWWNWWLWSWRCWWWAWWWWWECPPWWRRHPRRSSAKTSWHGASWHNRSAFLLSDATNDVFVCEVKKDLLKLNLSISHNTNTYLSKPQSIVTWDISSLIWWTKRQFLGSKCSKSEPQKQKKMVNCQKKQPILDMFCCIWVLICFA